MNLLIGDEIEVEIAIGNLFRLTAEEFGALIIFLHCALEDATKDLLEKPDIMSGLKGLTAKGVLKVTGKDEVTVSFRALAQEGGI